jgi:hypothetical protein
MVTNGGGRSKQLGHFFGQPPFFISPQCPLDFFSAVIMSEALA